MSHILLAVMVPMASVLEVVRKMLFIPSEVMLVVARLVLIMICGSYGVSSSYGISNSST